MFQPLTWLGLAWVLVRLEQTEDERWWLAFGAIAGFSLNTKYLIAFYLAALAIALLVTPRRKSLLRPWVYLGALLALVLVLPNVLWQQAHGWPFIELGKAGASIKNIAMSPGAFFLQQILLIGPVAMVVWLAGVWGTLVRPGFGVARAFPIAWLILFLVFDISHGKPYYLAPIYPALLAFGALRIEEWFSGVAVRGVVLAALAGVVITGLLWPRRSPCRYSPWRPSSGMKAWSASNAFDGRARQARRAAAILCGHVRLAGNGPEKVAAVYWALPLQAKRDARRLLRKQLWRGRRDRCLRPPPRASARAISGNNNYYLWGPRGA